MIKYRFRKYMLWVLNRDINFKLQLNSSQVLAAIIFAPMGEYLYICACMGGLCPKIDTEVAVDETAIYAALAFFLK